MRAHCSKNFATPLGAILGLALTWHSILPIPAKSQGFPEGSIDIAYIAPTNPAFRTLYETLKSRQVLEELRLFLSPLRLPHNILVRTDECGTFRVPYESGHPVDICYEYVAQLVSLANAREPSTGISREDAIVGAFAQLVLHEVSLALFDVLQIPIWGREEDAADKLTAFLLSQLGKDASIKLLGGAVWLFDASDRTWTGSDFASETSPEAQRFYNYLCIAYGGDPDRFKELVRDTLLKTRRAENCTNEYQELSYAVRKIILPHIDPNRLNNVQSMQWAQPKSWSQFGYSGPQ
jgi:hypothetical protein